MTKVHAEIIYRREGTYGVHSDICPPNCNLGEISDEYRKFLHDNLDEWLDKSEGTGIFYITEAGFKDCDIFYESIGEK